MGTGSDLSLFDGLPDPLIILDATWRFRFLNLRAAEVSSIGRDALMGQVVWDVFPVLRGMALETQYHRAMNERVRVEFEQQTADGQRVYRIACSPFEDGLCVVFHDITAFRRASDAAHFRGALLDAVGESVVVVDPSGTVIRWNRAAELLYGHSAADAIGRFVTEVVPSRENGLDDMRMIAQATAGQILRLEISVPRVDGPPVPAEVTLSALHNEHGQPVAVVGVGRDISRRRAVEESLRESQHRYHALYRLLPIPAFLWRKQDDDFQLVEGNEAAVRYTDGRLPQALGRWARALWEKEPTLLQWFARCLAEEAPHTVEIDRVMEGVGERRVLVVTFAPVPPDQVLVLVQDVTEAKRAQELLRARDAELQRAQRMEALGRMAGGVAHDFNNLMTAVAGYAALAMEQLPDGAPLRSDILEISRAADRGAVLTRQLLTFSRQQPARPRPLDPGAVVEDLVRLLQRLVGETVTVTLKRTAEPLLVLADPAQLEQVFLNLALNARDAMPAGGSLEIRVENVRVTPIPDGPPAGDCVRIEVMDSGVGMDDATRARIFEPFFTTKGPGKGTGLGLPAVYGIVQQGQGHITVVSSPGCGTTVRIHLPREHRAPVLPEPPPPPPPIPDASGGTVLVVEDDPRVRATTVRLIKRAGHQVLEAEDGEEALRRLEEHGGVDLVVSDVVMPRMGGLELLRRLSERPGGPPVMLVSGYASDEIRKHGPLPAGTVLLEKPFTAQALLACVHELIAGPGRRP